MASSGVEIATSSPFGCVLRDRNHRDGCRESSKVKATHAVFQRNIKNFVMDHLNTCITVSSDSATNENNNEGQMKNNNNDNVSSWASKGSTNLARLHLKRNNQNGIINNNKDNENEPSLTSLISPRHSRLLDRWAARQAREMVSNLENEAELLSIDNTNNDNDMPEVVRASSSTSDECSSEKLNLGASSLVQLWEKRLNNSNGSKPNTPMEKTSPTGGTSATCNNENVFVIDNPTEKTSPTGGTSVTCNNENVFVVNTPMEKTSPTGGTNATCNNVNVFVVGEQRGSELGEGFEGLLSSGNVESFSFSSFTDWDSDKTGDQSRLCSGDQSRWNSSESDRVSVADIIKKLTATSQTQSPPPSSVDENDHEGYGGGSVASSPRKDFAPELSEHRAFPQVNCSTRIRGRQAFNDLLMQLERDRHGELKNLAERGTVSKFAQKGRIQALLRLKLLRGAAANVPSHQKSTSCEVHRQVQPHGSAIMQLRRKFSTRAEERNTVQAEVANTRSPPKEIVNNITQLENSTTADQISKDTSSQIVHETVGRAIELTKSETQTSEEDHPSSTVMSQETCFEAQRTHSEETTSITDSNVKEKEKINQQYDETSYDCAVEEEGSNQNYAESSYEEMVEESYDESNYDWISEISRPRSYWEERRQAWYREMLDTGSPNEDIQVLLERRTVSTFLSSGFRETMDRLMQSHRGSQTHLVSSQDDDIDNEGLMAFFQEHLYPGRSPQENGTERTIDEEVERVNEDEEEEEEQDEKEHEEEQGGESLVSSLCHEVGDYSNQSSSWSYRDNEAGDDFDRVASTSSQPYQSPSSYHDNRPNSSSTNHHSIEMELIYDMRGHMEQLYQEMSELRKSIQSCMDMQMQMQMQLQNSNNQRVQTAEKEEKKSHNKTGKKGNCCICNEMKVDSVLYRCGHMCACLKCAKDLRWNNGKCPICRAKIDDVVRVYLDV